MKYSALIKSNMAHRILSADIKNSNVSHAYLLVSADEYVGDVLCAMFVSEIFGGNAERVLSGGYADIINIPEKDAKLNADAVKKITDTALVTPVELDKKFYIISDGETMNDAAQNKLLKVLEEPPSSVIIIIKCKSTFNILPTIVSRCRTVDVAPFTEDMITAELKKTHTETDDIIYAAAAYSGGSISAAEEFLSGGGGYRIFKLAMEVLQFLKNSRSIVACSNMLIKEKDNLTKVIYFLELILSDCMLFIEAGATYIKLKGSFKEISILSEMYNTKTILGLSPVFLKAKTRLKYNGNALSVIEEMLFSILEVKSKCQK